MSSNYSATSDVTQDDIDSKTNAANQIELTNLNAPIRSESQSRSSNGEFEPMFSNPMHQAEDDQTMRDQIAKDKEIARVRLLKRMRQRHVKSKGEHKHPTVDERREQRAKNKRSSVHQAKGMLGKFWNGHREGRTGKPPGHHGSDSKTKEQHEADYAHFLKHKFLPDICYSGDDQPHISSVRARVRQALRSPRIVETIQDETEQNLSETDPAYDNKTGTVTFHSKKYSPISCCGSNTGTHKCHCRCCHLEGTGSEFAAYGLGIVLWFKYVKWISIIFMGLTLLALPQWLMFGSSGKLMGQLETESKLHVLAQLGMANMGEGSTLCVSESENQMLSLQCGIGQKIASITSVHYGFSTGLCECPGTSSNELKYGARLPPDYRNPMSCFNDDGKYLYPGTEQYNQQRCCSDQQLVSGKGDFNKLKFKNTATCYSPNIASSSGTANSNSTTSTTTSSNGCEDLASTTTTDDSGSQSYAYSIVSKGCLGKKGCQILVNERTQFNATGHYDLCNETIGRAALVTAGVANWTDFDTNSNRSVAYHCKNALGTDMFGCNLQNDAIKTLNIVAVCSDESLMFFGTQVSKNMVWIVLTLTEVGQCLFILFMVFMMTSSTAADVTEQANEIQSIELFTIFLPRIHEIAHDPIYKDQENSKLCLEKLKNENKKDGCCIKYPTHMVDTTKLKGSLKHHFERLLSKTRPVVSQKLLGMDGETWDKCQLYKNWPVKVADVKFGRCDGEVIRLQKLRGHLLHELQHETAHLEHHHMALSQTQLKKMEDHIHKELDRLETYDEKIAELEANPTIHNPECAFITFQKREDKLRALATYPRSSLFYCMCQPRDPCRCLCSEKRIRAYVPPKYGGKEKEDVRPKTCSCTDGSTKYYRTWINTETPSPENIRWENLTVSPRSRCTRVLCSCLITIILLLATIGGGIIVKNENLKAGRLYPKVDCNAISIGQPNDQISKNAAILDEMQLERINSTSFIEKNAKQSFLGCFCSAQPIQDLYGLNFDLKDVPGLEVQKFNVPEGFASNSEYKRNWCLKWLSDTTKEQGLSIASVLLIVIINMLLKVIMKRLVNFERPISQSKFSTSLTTKLTIFQFLNTALVTMLVNANLNDFDTGDSDPTLGGLVFNGDYSDFTKGWHLQIGTALLLTMIINLSTPLVFYWLLPWYAKCVAINKDRSRCCCCCQHPKESKKITQGDYENMLLGGPFGLEARYAIVNMVTGVSIVFGPSTPLLYPFAFIYLILQYWADKVSGF